MNSTAKDASYGSPSTTYVIGIDEAGRGCMAGPVSIAAACFRLAARQRIAFIADDSKALSEKAREEAMTKICEALKTTPAKVLAPLTTASAEDAGPVQSVSAVHAASPTLLGFCEVLAAASVIDEINILNASLEGMSRACSELVHALARSNVALTADNTVVLIDGNRLPWHFQTAEKRLAIEKKALKSGNRSAIGVDYENIKGFPCVAVTHGDAQLLSVATASIIAKVTRDAFTVSVMHKEFPCYGFSSHKGYCTAEHCARIKASGPCKYHRIHYAPVKAVLDAHAPVCQKRNRSVSVGRGKPAAQRKSKKKEK